ncbi:hypothetical protein ACQEVB_03070 [Pseudonocardia sp. CA-107938]|uniref:hypothetical protein n=1 Tax=Pseudonocardia sp. CA-107938 TaxID=3240021 RepID=UPI003D8CC998
MTVLLAVAVLGLLLAVAALVVVRDVDARLAAVLDRCAAAPERLEHLRERAVHAAEAEAQLAEELAAVLDVGTTGVRDVHRAISDIPFDILGSFGATRESSERVREVHDRTADGVYDAISAVNKAATSVYRAWFKRS